MEFSVILKTSYVVLIDDQTEESDKSELPMSKALPDVVGVEMVKMILAYQSRK